MWASHTLSQSHSAANISKNTSERTIKACQTPSLATSAIYDNASAPVQSKSSASRSSTRSWLNIDDLLAILCTLHLRSATKKNQEYDTVSSPATASQQFPIEHIIRHSKLDLLTTLQRQPQISPVSSDHGFQQESLLTL